MKRKSDEKSLSRRELLGATAAASGVVLFGSAHKVFSTQGDSADLDPRVTATVAKSLGIDTHNHVDVPMTPSEVPGPTIDLAGELRKSGLSAICMTFAVDYVHLVDPGQAYSRFKCAMGSMDEQLKLNKMTRSLNLAELGAAHDQKQPTVVQSVEGAHFLEGKLDRLGEAYGRGLRHLGLLHDSDASVPLGDVYTNPPKFGGITQFGKEVLQECERLGMLVDLAHASADTVDGALKIVSKPVLISHTGLDTQLGSNPNMAQMMRPRLISKERAKIVADAGGVIGVWTHLADSPDEYAKNVRALVDVIGVDHVCIGTDTKLTPSNMQWRGGPPPGGQGGPGGPGSPQGGPQGENGGIRVRSGPRPARPGERTNEAWTNQKAGFYFAVVDAMLKAGFTEDEIGKIGGGNFCRLFDAATKGH